MHAFELYVKYILEPTFRFTGFLMSLFWPFERVFHFGLASMINSKGMKFISGNGEIEIECNDFSKEKKEIINKIISNCTDYLIIEADELYRLLDSRESLCSFALFLKDLMFPNKPFEKKDIRILVKTDLNKLSTTYQNLCRRNPVLKNKFSSYSFDMISGQMSLFEQHWNIAINEAINHRYSYIGRDKPRDVKSSMYLTIEIAQKFIIGKGDQLDRYIVYAKQLGNPIFLMDITKMVHFFRQGE